MIRFLHEMGIEFGLLLAGLSGGIVALRKDEKLNIYEKSLTVISGGISAIYITPLLLDYLSNVLTEQSKYGLAFFVGYVGLKGLEIIIIKIIDIKKK